MQGSNALDARPKGLRVWWLAIRPATLWAAVVPVGVGTAVAFSEGLFQALPAIAALAGAMFIQVGTNLANDYFDFQSGADTEQRLGPARATQRGWLAPRQVALGAATALVIAAGIGSYLVAVGGWPIALVGVASLVLAVCYTGGPFPLAYHGLGDVFVLVFFGFVAVCGTVWVQGAHVPGTAWLAAVPVGTLATAILVVNNLRDRHTDAVAGKRTLAVRLGAAATRREYAILLCIAWAVGPIAWATGAGGAGWMLPWLATPLAIRELRGVYSKDGARLNEHLGGTARLELIYGFLLGVGIVL